MPPPTTPTPLAAPLSQESRALPPRHSSFTTRDSAIAKTINRPGSSMSISSMLGSDADLPPRESATLKSISNPSPNRTTAFSSPQVFTSPGPSSTRYLDHAGVPSQSSRSPERVHSAKLQSTRPARAYSSGTIPRPYQAANIDPLEAAKSKPPSLSTLSKHPSIANTGSRAGDNTAVGQHSSMARSLSHSSSQPNGFKTPPPEIRESESIERMLYTPKFESGPGKTETKIEQRPRMGESSMANSVLDNQSRQSQESMKQAQAMRNLPEQKPAVSLSYPFLSSRGPAASGPRALHSQSKPSSNTNRPSDHESGISSTTIPTYSPEPSRHIQHRHQTTANSQGSSDLSTLASRTQPQESVHNPRDQIRVQSTTTVIPGVESSRTIDGVDQSTRTRDEHSSSHRNSLALAIDNSKRGRISPLPQAVQGAQGRLNGPASDPGIKNEFARMFMGIGTGVSRTGRLGSGTSSPFPSSPTKNLDSGRRTPFAGKGELLELSRSRMGSRAAKRGRKSKEEESKPEEENGEDQDASTALSLRGPKRSRNGHHYHLHSQNHQ